MNMTHLNRLFIYGFLALLMLMIGYGYAAESERSGGIDLNEYPYPKTKIFFTEGQRAQVEQSRRQYLLSNPVSFDGIEIMETTIHAKQSNVPEKITVTSIIVGPDGSKKVWLNGRFQSPQKKTWHLNESKTSAYAAVFWLSGKSVTVPVGYTYWIQSGRLEKTRPSILE